MDGIKKTEEGGYTCDYTVNTWAKSKMRIDRIYLRATYQITAVNCHMIGTEAVPFHDINLFPSDHFGLETKLKLHEV